MNEEELKEKFDWNDLYNEKSTDINRLGNFINEE